MDPAGQFTRNRGKHVTRVDPLTITHLPLCRSRFYCHNNGGGEVPWQLYPGR